MESRESSRERERISRMHEDAEDLRNWPGSYFPAIAKANAALAAWKEKYPEAAAAEKEEAERKAAARKAEREANYRNSFIGKGID